ncbi:MAG: hypothetical protein IJW82_07755, partial [Clostridia bacterium]|nr:hypothetical protein [Clostridia bacterium]
SVNSYTISIGDVVKVKLIDEFSDNYEESDWSQEVEFEDTRIQIPAPILTYTNGVLAITGTVVGDLAYQVAQNDINNPINTNIQFSSENEEVDITWLFEISSGDTIYARVLPYGVYNSNEYIESEWVSITIE